MTTQRSPRVVATRFAIADLDPGALTDVLSAALAHERAGSELYRSVAERTTVPSLRARYDRYRLETEDHIVALEDLVRVAGGDPAYESPMATYTAQAGKHLLESTTAPDDKTDRVATELAMLEAVIAAEMKDRANWEMLADLADRAADSAMRDLMQRTVRRVLAEEDEHFEWATSTHRRVLRSMAVGRQPAWERPTRPQHRRARRRRLDRSELHDVAARLRIPHHRVMSDGELRAAITDRAS